jgi:protein PhnA
MNISELNQRSGGQCELCLAKEPLTPYEVPPTDRATADASVILCESCLRQVERKEPLESQRWRCLSESMWSEVPAVQVLAWRMLQRLRGESWAAENLDVLYLADELLPWAKATGDHDDDGAVKLHQDCNGNLLSDGDTVVLAKSLEVKGSTLTAKMGTVVKNIRLVTGNTDQIEGRVEGQLIVILTKYVRKQGA